MSREAFASAFAASVAFTFSPTSASPTTEALLETSTPPPTPLEASTSPPTKPETVPQAPMPPIPPEAVTQPSSPPGANTSPPTLPQTSTPPPTLPQTSMSPAVQPPDTAVIWPQPPAATEQPQSMAVPPPPMSGAPPDMRPPAAMAVMPPTMGVQSPTTAQQPPAVQAAAPGSGPVVPAMPIPLPTVTPIRSLSHGEQQFPVIPPGEAPRLGDQQFPVIPLEAAPRRSLRPGATALSTEDSLAAAAGGRRLAGEGAPVVVVTKEGLGPSAPAFWTPLRREWCCTHAGVGCVTETETATATATVTSSSTTTMTPWVPAQPAAVATAAPSIAGPGVAPTVDPIPLGTAPGMQEPQQSFNCEAGIMESTSWTEEKRIWCCDHERVGCS